jgi:hypothetical protein
MKKSVPLGLLTLMIVAATLACRLPGLSAPTATDEPEATQVIIGAEPTATEDALPSPEPTSTEDVSPSPEPAATDPEPTAGPPTSPDNAGQIAYTFNGNLWWYIIDSDEAIQMTTDAVTGDHMTTYRKPGFSPDGRYLAYNQGNNSWVTDLVNDTLIDISAYGQFFAWSDEDSQFFGVKGDFACPDIEDLDDQYLINFDILRFDIENISNPTLLVNIGGGLKVPVEISGDGQWASIAHCACYSECGSENLWHLPTASSIDPPIDMYPGNIDFSPDNTQLTVSQHQMFGYMQSPLYVANINYAGMTEVFSIPDVAPVNAQWSPDGAWLAFTGVIFDEDAFTEIDRCVRLVKPDGSQEYVAECMFAEFVTWSPDGGHLLYSQRVGAKNQLYIYNLGTSARTKLPIQADPYTLVDWGRLP